MPTDDSQLGEELTALRAEVAALRAELAELREYIGDVPSMECWITGFEEWQKGRAERGQLGVLAACGCINRRNSMMDNAQALGAEGLVRTIL